MNWMGGNLSRHRRGKGWKEDMARQKEYFARTRSRQRDGVQTNPVPLSAANFIPNYAPPSEATTSPGGAGFPSSTLISKPLCDADGTPTSLGNPSKGSQKDVTELPLLVSLGKRDGFLTLNQASEGHFLDAADLETEFQGTLRLPKLSVRKPRQKIFEHVPLSKRTLEQQRQRRTSTSHHKVAPSFDRQRDIRKRKAVQNTPSTSPRSVRIRVGSQDYRWSEARNSIGNPTFGDHSATQSTASEQTKHKTQSRSVSNASYTTSETFTGFSPSSSDLPWSSPCRNRAARRPELYTLPKEVVGAAAAEIQRPLQDCACGAATKSSSAASEIESTDSIAVQVSDCEIMPDAETDEERIWRQWLG